MEFAGRIHNKTAGKRVCGRFLSRYAHGQQKRPQQSQVGNRKCLQRPTTVVTANGEAQTEEEATVYVRELDLFVTVRLLENTPAVLSLGKLCE